MAMLNIWKSDKFFLRILTARLLITSKHYSKGDNSSSSDDENINEKTKSKKDETIKAKDEDVALKGETAAARLNRLLASMQTADDQFSKSMVNIVPRPGELNRKRREQKKSETESKDIFAAASTVASLLSENNKQKIESELLSKLLGRSANSEESTDTNDIKTPKESEISLTELIVGMKIDRSQRQADTPSRSDYVKRSIAAKGRQQRQQYDELREERLHKISTSHLRKPEVFSGSVKLFDGPALEIFTKPHELKPSPDILSTWSQLDDKTLKIQVARPPANYFEKIALWTEQGKVWRFPINNEQDWSEEHNVDFSEHIFLDQHLESWCPQRGPIRHFMELVCVGLSKNPYLTAQEKKEHILWYRDYFESKKDILKKVMNEENLNQLQASVKIGDKVNTESTANNTRVP